MEMEEQIDSYVKIRGYEHSTGNRLAEVSGMPAGSPELYPNIEKFAENPEKMDYGPEEMAEKLEVFESSIVSLAESYGKNIIKKYSFELENDEGDNVSANSLEEFYRLVDDGFEELVKGKASYQSAETNSAPTKGFMIEDFRAFLKYMSPGRERLKKYPAMFFSRVEMNRPKRGFYEKVRKEMDEQFPAQD